MEEITSVVFAAYEDVSRRWIASSILPDANQVEAYLEDASMIMLAEFPQLQDNVAQDKQCAARARLVCVRMVIRVLSNPDQFRQTQETDGPFSSSYTWGAETLGGLYLTSEDRLLLAQAPKGQSRVFSIAPTAYSRLCGGNTLSESQIVNGRQNEVS